MAGPLDWYLNSGTPDVTPEESVEVELDASPQNLLPASVTSPLPPFQQRKVLNSNMWNHNAVYCLIFPEMVLILYVSRS